MLVSWKMCDESREVLGYESLAGEFEPLAFQSRSEKSSIAETALRYSLWWMKREESKECFLWWIQKQIMEGRGRGKKKVSKDTVRPRQVQNEPQQRSDNNNTRNKRINRYRNLKNYGVMEYGEKRLGTQHWKTPRPAELQSVNVPGMVELS